MKASAVKSLMRASAMITAVVATTLTSTFAPTASAAGLKDDILQIHTLCKTRFPGDLVVQGYCKTENLNYQKWLQHIEASLPSSSDAYAEVVTCKRKHKPDYHKAFDCYTK